MGNELPRKPLEDILAEGLWLKKLALALVRDPVAAEELVQDTLVAALEAPPATSGSLRGWLQQVLRHRAVDRKRQEERARRRETKVAEQRATEASHRLSGPDRVAELLDLQHLLVGAVRDLEEPYRSAVVLRFHEQLDARAIGFQLHLPEATVRSHISRGLAILRRRLQSRYGPDWQNWCLAALGPSGIPVLVSSSIAMSTTFKIGAGAAGLLLAGILLWHAASPEVPHGDDLAVSPPSPASVDQNDQLVTAVGAAAAAAPEAATERTMAAQPPRGTRLRVVDASGLPVADAHVRVYAVEGRWRTSNLTSDLEMQLDYPPLEAELLTDAAGEARFEQLVPDRQRVFAVQADGHARRAIVAPAVPDSVSTDLGDVALAPGFRLVVQVEDGSGRRLTDAKAWVHRSRDSLPGTPRSQSQRADAQGIIDFRSLAEGAETLIVKAPGFASHQEDVGELLPTTAMPRVVRLQKGGAIDVTVQEADGSSAVGVELYHGFGVNDWPATRMRPERDEFIGRTDLSGFLRIEGVESGDMRVCAKRGAAWVRSATVHAGDAVRLTLPAVHRLTGRVMTPGNAPAQGGRFAVIHADEPSQAPDAMVQLSGDARFEAELAAGRYGWCAWHPDGGSLAEQTILVDRDIDLGDIVLDEPARVLARAIDASSGSVLAEATIQAGAAPAMHWERSGNSWCKTAMALVGSFQRNEAVTGGRLLVLGAGQYRVQAQTPGYVWRTQNVDLKPGDNPDLTLPLVRGAELRLRLLGSHGQPIAGEILAIWPDSYDPEAAMGRDGTSIGSGPITKETGKDGWVEFAPVVPGRWLLGYGFGAATRGASARLLDLFPGPNEVIVQREETATVTFRVTGPDGPIQGARVRVQLEPAPGEQATGAGWGWDTDERGEWTLEGISPARYLVDAAADGYLPVREAMEISPSTEQVELRFEGFHVSGAVRGAPAGACAILAEYFRDEPHYPADATTRMRNQFWSERPSTYVHYTEYQRFGWTTTQADGTFRIGGCSPGMYLLVVQATGFLTTEPREVDLRSGSLEGLVIEVEPAAEVRLRVRGMAGLRQAHAEAMVNMATASDAAGTNVTGQPHRLVKDGEVRLGPLHPGVVKISLYLEGLPASIPQLVYIPATTAAAGMVTEVEWDAQALLAQ